MVCGVHLRRLNAHLLLALICTFLLSPAKFASSSPVFDDDSPGASDSKSVRTLLLSSDSSSQQVLDMKTRSAVISEQDSKTNVLTAPKVDLTEDEDQNSVKGAKDNEAPEVENNGSSGSEAANSAGDAEGMSNTSSSNAVSNPDESNETNSSADYNVALGPFNAGAVWRGFLVFVGCSVVVVLYLGIRTACRRRGRGQRRYHKVDRGDELDVFPLTEADDDDEEIFSADVQR